MQTKLVDDKLKKLFKTIILKRTCLCFEKINKKNDTNSCTINKLVKKSNNELNKLAIDSDFLKLYF